MERQELDRIGKGIIDAAVQVHRSMGPGLLESVYEECLVYEFRAKGMSVTSQVPAPLEYRGKILKENLWIDLMVEEQVIIEIKAVEAVHPVHQAQLLSYLRLIDLRLGYLINFNVPRIKEGFHRYVNGL